MRTRNAVIVGVLGIMVALGLLVNSIFLLLAIGSLCGVAHLFGHHGGHGHDEKTHDHKSMTNGKDKASD